MYSNTYLRQNCALEKLYHVPSFSTNNFIMPYLIYAEKNEQARKELGGVKVATAEDILEDVAIYEKKGLQGIFFSLYNEQESTAQVYTYKEYTYSVALIEKLKAMYPHLFIMMDITSCISNNACFFGVTRSGRIHIDATIDMLIEIAITYAKSGVDILVHSGQVAHTTHKIKKVLMSLSIYNVAIMGYIAQEKDVFSPMLCGDVRKSASNVSKAQYMSIAEYEVNSGVDILGVGSMYSADIVACSKATYNMPIFVLQTMVESMYMQSMLHTGGCVENIIMPCYTSLLRAGGTAIITPFTYTMLDMIDKNVY